MKIAFHIAFGIHLLSILGVLALLVISYKKSPRALNPGVLHSAATALVAGIVMVGTWSAAHETEINHLNREEVPRNAFQARIDRKAGTYR